ncbi:MAG: TnsA endonuclease N-terminal domain-containing protein [Candidatus Eisenbacteria bacterium]
MRRYRQGWSRGWKKSTRGVAGEWFDSYWEVQYMDELDRDPLVLKWTRHHGLQIPYRKWWGGQGHYKPDFLVEIAGGEREIREVKGEHLFGDPNTSRKLKAGDTFCRQHGMKFSVVTKSLVNPESWAPEAHVRLESPSPTAAPPQTTRKPGRSGCLGVAAVLLSVVGFLIWLGLRVVS